MLIEIGTLTVVVVPNFAAWWVLMTQFEEQKSNMRASAVAQLRAFASALGMDASSRVRLGSP
ncbi:MAG TPA: hypothetical protein VM166_02195, partial [Gemmatimonadaceae bacterium]|nr:hypothetical protein [Gemmatimonadaceae bacterium]